MPVGRAFDAVPINLAVGVDIAQPRDFGMLLVAVTDERMDARCAEPLIELPFPLQSGLGNQAAPLWS